MAAIDTVKNLIDNKIVNTSVVYPYIDAIVTEAQEGLTDVSDTTAVAADVVAGKFFYLADGTKVEGTLVI